MFKPSSTTHSYVQRIIMRALHQITVKIRFKLAHQPVNVGELRVLNEVLHRLSGVVLSITKEPMSAANVDQETINFISILNDEAGIDWKNDRWENARVKEIR